MKKLHPLLPFLPLLPALLCAIWIITTLFPSAPASPYDIAAFGHLPVLADGRVKPLDTIARTTLLRIQGRQAVRSPDGRAITPAEWLLDAVFNPDAAREYRVFQITNPEVLDLVQLTTADGDGGKRYSPAQLAPRLDAIEQQASLAASVDNAQRTPFQRAILDLHDSLATYQSLTYSLVLQENPDYLGDLMDAKNTGKLRNEAALMTAYGALLAMPPNATQPAWLKTGDALTAALDARRPPPPAALAYAAMSRAWQTKQPAQFNELLHAYQEQLTQLLPATDAKKTNAEWRFNAAEPFYAAMILCVLAFLLGVAAWLKWPGLLARSSLWVLGLAWLIMTAGILTRMWLEGRPPVTNLYSSALGVGAFAVTLCVIIEAIFKTNIVNVAGSLLGFGTLIIAHHLSFSGDTMEMMRAVLDSNFWLATHVLTIAFGYAATYAAGIIAIIVILYRLVASEFDPEIFDLLERIVYGIVCFAIFFSFLGTVLGGVWADQSWGRFWGWDPKENGALIIVIWNAVVLHARWGKFVGPTGVMALAVFGNIVTTWSWFGVNQLSVGLHNYGFKDGNTLPIIAFMLANLVIIALALLPARRRA